MFAIHRIGIAVLLCLIFVAPSVAGAADNWQEPALESGRSNYLNGYRPVSAARSGNVVTLSGLLKNTRHGTVATLPRDMRPARRLIFDVNVHDSTARLDVHPDGRVVMTGGNTGYGWISLDGVSFPVGRGRPLSLENGWRNYGGGFADADAMRQGDTVFLGGLVIPGNDRVIAKLPPDMRPSEALIFNVLASDKAARIDVYPDGRIIAIHHVAHTQWLSLDGIAFNRKKGQPLTLMSGWRNYGQQYAPATVTRTGDRISVSGLVKATGGSWGHLATLPKSMCPDERLIFDLNNHDRSARVDVIADCRIFWVAGGRDHGWLSLDGLAFYLKPTSIGGGPQAGSGAESGSAPSGYSDAEKQMIKSAGALVEELKIPVLKDNWRNWKDRFEKDGEMLTYDVKLFGQQATVAVYRPRGKRPSDPVNLAVLTDNVKISNLIAPAAGTVADDLQVNKATYIFAPKGNEEYTDTGSLPPRIRQHVEQVRTGPIDILGGHNMFALVNTRDNGETAKFLKQVNVPLDHLKVNAAYGVRKSRATGKREPYQAVRLMRPGRWDRAFYLDGVRMEAPTFEYAKRGNVKVFRAWGTADIDDKGYFMFAQKTGTVGPYPTAVSLDTDSISLSDYVKLGTLFADTLFNKIPAFQNLEGGTSHLAAALDRVKIKNPRYSRANAVDKDNNPVFKDVLFMAASPVDELPDGKRTKGAAMVAHGTGEVFGLDAASIDAEIYKNPHKSTELDVTAKVTLPSHSSLRLGGFDFRLFKNGKAFAARLDGNAKLTAVGKTVFDKKISFDVDNSGLIFKLPATCPVQLYDWKIQAGFDLRSASEFRIQPSLGCDPLDMLQSFLAAGKKLVGMGTALTEKISADTWRGLRSAGGGKITANVVADTVRTYGNPANATRQLAHTGRKVAEAGKKVADGAVSTVAGLVGAKSSTTKLRLKPIYRDDPDECTKGQLWNIEYGTCWTPGAEMIRLALDPSYCISVSPRTRISAPGGPLPGIIVLWKCDGDWHQQWRRGKPDHHVSGIRDSLDEGYCWEGYKKNTLSRPCGGGRELQQVYYRDGQDRLIAAFPSDETKFLASLHEGKVCLSAETPLRNGSPVFATACVKNATTQNWIFETKNSFR